MTLPTRATPTEETQSHFDTGVKYYDQGTFADALTEFQKAVLLDPKHPTYLYNLGMSYYKTGNLAKAEESMILAISHSPGYARAFSALGFIWEKRGEKDKARAAYRRALTLSDMESFALRALERLEGNIFTASRKPWTIDFRTSSTKFETNPSQLPPSSNPRTDMVVVPSLDLSYKLPVNRAWNFKFLYNAELDQYLSQRELGFNVHFLRAESEWPISAKVTPFVRVDVETDIGTRESFYQSTGLAGGFTFGKLGPGKLRVSGGLKNEIYPTARTRDANNATIDLTWSQSLLEQAYLYLAFQYRLHASLDPDYSYDRTATTAVLTYFFPDGVSWQSRVLWMPRKYTNRDSVAAVFREDTLLQLSIENSREIFHNIDFRTTLQYFNNGSNIGTRVWNDMLLSSGIDFHF